MNIKGLLGNILPSGPILPTRKTERTIKSDSTSDRDANGQQAGGGEQQQREPMTEEQINKAIEHLRNIPGVKEHNWSVELSVVENKKFVLVKDTSGNIIRRIPELDLWTLTDGNDSGKGQLFTKSA
ncbi:MAG: flagellar protein FlaG [Pseudobdellovibrionaceae bacterium]